MAVHVRYKGVFDKNALIKAVIDLFEKGGYEHYFYQTKCKTQDFGEEEEYGLRGWFNETEYHRVYMDIYLHLWDSNPVDVVHNGMKKTMTKALLHITVDGKLVKDHNDMFQRSMFGKKLQGFMEKYVTNEKYNTIWEDEMEYRLQRAADYFKDFLKCNSVGKYF